VNNDHSSTDIALCNHLAFWTDKDASKMDSMFRESALIRDKWDKVHHSVVSTYGERTIDETIKTTPTTISDYSDNQPYEIYISSTDDEAHAELEKEDNPFHLTELGNAERIVYHHGKNLRYCNELEWLTWNGKHWEVDGKREIEAIAAKT